jgi:phosphoenolpyruvate-protein phosphotransferase
MGLGVREGDLVRVHASGADAAEAAVAVVAALETHSEAGHAAPPAAATVTAVGVQPESSDGLIAGVCAAPGLAIGQVVRLDAYEPEVPEQGSGANVELQNLVQALQAVRGHLADELRHAEQRGAKEEGEILRAHQALADDPELVSAAERHIDNGHSAAFAFRQSVRAQCAVLQSLGNALLAERVGDLKDLERRVLSVILGEASGIPELSDAAILVAEDLAPSELTRLPRAKVAGILTSAGGATAHVAILARALGIPALVACGSAVLALEAGRQLLLDASNGRCDPAPSEGAIAQARRQIDEREQRRNVMLESAAAPALTTDGVAIEVAANIGNEADAREGVRNGADGVGLLRTEFLFIDRNDAPTTEEQRTAYQAVLDALGERNAIIRTLDIGGDKEVPFLPLPAEPNPALGLRGIRTGFARPEILDAQLTALLQIKPLSRLRILVPMIAEVSELLQLRQRIDALAGEMGLSERPQLGVMIEVPSAALLADQLAAHADFLSIGTNDLTQYTLAMDRCHPGLAARLDSLHPSLLRLIAMTVDGARKHGKWVGVCGALASDPDAVPVLVGLGVSELSVSPALVPEIKSRVRALSAEQCRRDAQALLQLNSAQAVRAHLRAVGVES